MKVAKCPRCGRNIKQVPSGASIPMYVCKGCMYCGEPKFIDEDGSKSNIDVTKKYNDEVNHEN